jgi:hypothetical protein
MIYIDHLGNKYVRGHDGSSRPCYNDHRDNVTGGGFAFATYHPGTSLPQQNWRP